LLIRFQALVETHPTVLGCQPSSPSGGRGSSGRREVFDALARQAGGLIAVERKPPRPGRSRIDQLCRRDGIGVVIW
jgi:hypothetical protein